MKTIADPEPPADFALSTDQLAYIILTARGYDALVDSSDPDEGSNAADDRAVDALEDTPDNPIGRELRAAISSLNVEAQIDLVALAWIGRGDFDDWAEARLTARDGRRDGPTARYLMGLPLLGDYLENGAETIGLSLEAEEQTGLHHPATEQPSEEDRD
ncbi:MAG: DUF3775 domain-containing protein [Alphaproteobacteria bacterium]